MNDALSNTATAKLGIALPIIQGPFGGGLSTLDLATSVSNCGGLGSFGAHVLEPEQIGPLAEALRERTSAPFALNLWVSDRDAGADTFDRAAYEQAWPLFAPFFEELGVAKPEWPDAVPHPEFAHQVEALLEARPPVFSFVFGIPSAPILAECRRRSIVTVGAATSAAEAQALEAAGVDLIVASGADAGGHRPSFLQVAEESLIGTFSLVQQVCALVRTPVIAAGGIADAAGVRAAMALGAQAAQIGTAFLACVESGASDAHRSALLSPRSADTVLTRAFSGRLARGLRNRWSEALAKHQHLLPPFPITSWFSAQLREAALQQGAVDLIAFWSGQAAPILRHRHSADLMQALSAGLPSPTQQETRR